MQTRKDFAAVLVFVLTVLAVVADCPAREPIYFLFKKRHTRKARPKPALYLATPDSKSNEMLSSDSKAIRQAIAESADPNAGCGKLTLVVATHGWFETKTWPKELALAIKSRVNSNTCLCGWFDWRARAKHISPTAAAKVGRDKAGPSLGRQIVQLSESIDHVHLIGHSAGAWVISEAAKVVAKETDASLHLTFLDAYVPPFWRQSSLADFNSDPNTLVWADHYFTRDLTLLVTEATLSGAHNVDLSDIDPGILRIKDHEFPRYWYHATVLGGYARGRRYQGQDFFNRAGQIEYGFARSREAGTENWTTSAALKLGNKPVKIKKPKKLLKLPFTHYRLFKPSPK